MTKELRERAEDLDPELYEYGCPCTGQEGEATLCFVHGRDNIFAFARDIIDQLEGAVTVGESEREPLIRALDRCVYSDYTRIDDRDPLRRVKDRVERMPNTGKW